MERDPQHHEHQRPVNDRGRHRGDSDGPMRYLCDPALRSMMVGVAMSREVSRGEAEDIAQTIICRLLARGRPDLLADPEQLRRYVCVATLNGVRDLHRSARLKRTVPLARSTASGDKGDVEVIDDRDGLGAVEIALALRASVSQLAAMERMVLADLIAGRPVAETAAQLARSTGDVRRMRAALRTWLAQL